MTYDFKEETFKVLERSGFPRERVALMYLTGSRLYHLNTLDSDYDMVVYLFPTKKEVFNGTQLSVELKNNDLGSKVESVKVYDLRKVLRSLKKLSFNDLYLSSKPVFKHCSLGFFSLKLEESFKGVVLNSQKNLAMSLNGVGHKRSGEKYETQKDYSFVVFLHYVLLLLREESLGFGVFEKEKVSLKLLGKARKEEKLSKTAWGYDVKELLLLENEDFNFSELEDLLETAFFEKLK